ncbi:MAG: hypothetical protein HS101_01315 [Planctomycetia bacterium]|jgi:DNA-binding transcriptional regulator of glucitol operon|nr:hypothetical protein [Planctomycetia bacterium]MCC7315650.1 hypothetical protein [Planctomycetota bacterium]OQZ06115.1 MAG: hypothetical protein B6D36_06685 [Planctomycetes bacterium UTPLA1]
MSLKGFHVFFIAVCLVFLIVLGVWGIRDFQATGERMSICLGLSSLGATIILGAYGIWFLRKLRHLSFV